MSTHTDHIGQPRNLGLVPTPAKRRARCAKSPFPTVPESDWREVDRRKYFGAATVTDQKQTSGCVGFSGAAALSKLRAMRGQPFVPLSGPYLYSLVNGGRDQGAMILDALEALEKYGCATAEQCPLPNIYRTQTQRFDEHARNFRLSKGVSVESAAEAAAVILHGGVLQFGVRVGRNFERFDPRYVAAFERGSANHAVHADGLTHDVKHGWCFDVQNTWSTKWGDDGRFLWPIEYFDRTGYQEAFAHVAAIDTPGDGSGAR